MKWWRGHTVSRTWTECMPPTATRSAASSWFARTTCTSEPWLCLRSISSSLSAWSSSSSRTKARGRRVLGSAFSYQSLFIFDLPACCAMSPRPKANKYILPVSFVGISLLSYGAFFLLLKHRQDTYPASTQPRHRDSPFIPPIHQEDLPKNLQRKL